MAEQTTDVRPDVAQRAGQSLDRVEVGVEQALGEATATREMLRTLADRVKELIDIE